MALKNGYRGFAILLVLIFASWAVAQGFKSAFMISENADPADAGVVRMGNAEVLAWENSPTGVDITLGSAGFSAAFDALSLTEGGVAVPNVNDIGVTIQAFDATLLSLATLGTAPDVMAYTTGIDTWAETPLTAFARTLLDDATAIAARTTLSVDVAGTDNSTNVTLLGTLDYLTLAGQAITRGAIDLATDTTGTLAITSGGTGQVTQQAAIDALTNVGPATAEHVLTKDTTTGNAIWKVASGGADQNLFETILGDAGTSPVADTTTDTLSLLGTANQITTTGNAAADSVTFSLPQDIHTGATPSWTGANLSAGTTTLGGVAGVVDAGGATSWEVPNSAAPSTTVFGQIAGDNDAWAVSRGAIQTFDGTANTFVIATLASDVPTNGQVPKWNTGGTITWEDDATGAGGGDAVSVNGSAATDADFDDALPAAPANSVNVNWQITGVSPSDISANILLTEIDGLGIGVSGTELILAATEVNDTTWGDNLDPALTWKFDPTGVTNPAITFTDGVTNVSTGAFQIGGLEQSGTNTGDEALSTGSAGLDVSDHLIDLDVTPSVGSPTLEQSEDALQVKYDTLNFEEDATVGLRVKAAGIDLAAEVTGTLPVANGGTGATVLDDITGTANEIDVISGTDTIIGGNVILAISSTLDLGSRTSFEVPNSAVPVTDAFGELAGDNNAWAASRGAIQTFDGTANTFLVGALASDVPTNGQVPTWNTGGTITWETPGGGGAFSDAGDPIVPNTTTKDLALGTTHNNAAKLSVDGDADQVQLSVQGNATQTANLVLVENSAGSDLFTIGNLGAVTIGALLEVDERIRADGSQNVEQLIAQGNTTQTVPIFVVEKSDASDLFTVTNTGNVNVGSTANDGQLIIHDDDVGGDAAITIQAPDALGTAYTITLPPDDGTVGQFLRTDGVGVTTWVTAAGTGDVVGPASATDNAIARFDTTTGKLIQDTSGVTISDTSILSIASGGIAFTGTLPRKRVFISATAGTPTTTAGCSDAVKSESATGVNYFHCDFNGTVDNSWQTTFTLPENYDGGTFTAAVEWTGTHTAGDTVRWEVSMMSITDDDVIDTAFGTAVAIDDDTTATGDFQRTAETAAITASGTPVGGDRVWVQVTRNADHVNDDDNDLGQFMGVWLTFGIDQLSSED